ncbi:MAG: ABC transporter permease [Candidatus Methylomirabilales bacterium]
MERNQVLPRVPEVVVEGIRPPSLRRALSELWAYRGLVLAFATRDFKVKYKQATLGVAWALLQPLGLLGVFTLLVARAAEISTGDVPYPAFALSTLVPWLFLQNSVSIGAQALLQDSVLVRKVYFPREAPIVGAVCAASVEFGVGIGLFLVLGPLLGARVGWTVLLALPLFAVLAVLAIGVSCGLGALNVYYRDVRHILPFAIQLWMFASPVIYPLSAIPPAWRELYAILNPAAGLLEAFRQALASGALPDPLLLTVSTSATVGLALGGYKLFKRLEPAFADVI